MTRAVARVMQSIELSGRGVTLKNAALFSVDGIEVEWVVEAADRQFVRLVWRVLDGNVVSDVTHVRIPIAELGRAILHPLFGPLVCGVATRPAGGAL